MVKINKKDDLMIMMYKSKLPNSAKMVAGYDEWAIANEESGKI